MPRATEAESLLERPLSGKRIVVTRPEHQAGALSQLIRDAGGEPVLFPLLEILDVEDPRPLLDVIARLPSFDLAIFISPNAVNKAMSLIAAHGGLPAGIRVATIGKGSAQALRHFGVRDVIAPEGRFDSEALLERPELHAVAGKRIVVFRGDGGRELLGDTLIARGASVQYAECYRRSRPGQGVAPLLELWAHDELSAITATSSEGLRNLFDMVGKSGQQWLRKTPLFVPHDRIAETARELGLGSVVLTAPGDEGLVRAMIDWWSRTRAADIRH